MLVGSIGLWSYFREFWIEYLKKKNLTPKDYLLDIGCGTLRAGAPLIEFLDPGHYTGVDVREVAIAEAKKELVERGLEGRGAQLIHCPNIAELNLDRKFDVALAASVFVHMEDQVFGDCLKTASRHLAPAGRLFGQVNLVERHPDFRAGATWLGFPWVARSLDFYRRVGAEYGLRLVESVPTEDQDVLCYQKD